MCGIVGLLLRDRPVQREDLDLMNNTIIHRGPDGDGVYFEGNVGIGMRRLSIIDLEGGWQPITNETRTIQVVHNGEIYNYRELREELEQLGHQFQTESDTEAIVHAYEEWGGFDFAKRLRGMFGIAIWDKNTRELWLVRDRVGIKPMFFTLNNEGFAFASEIKALLASRIVQRNVDPVAISEYLTFGSADRESSFLQGVKQLLPGHAMRLTDRFETRVQPYWQYTTPVQRRNITESEAEELLLHNLRDSIRAHLVSDVPVGAFLSGGVDSSAIVGAAVQETNAPLKTFSIGFEEAKFNELQHARKVADKWGCEHHELIVRPDAVEIVEEIMGHFDEPFADASAIPTWFVSKLAAEHVKVVLSGDGGDELYAGYTRYKTAYKRLWLDQVPQFLRSAGSFVGNCLPNSWPGKFFLSHVYGNRDRRYAIEQSLFPGVIRRQLVRPEFQPERLGHVDPTDLMTMQFQQLASGDLIADCMALDFTRYLPMDILTKVDRMTMAHSLEARPPLLDHQFVEFSASLPTSLKFKSPEQQKYVLRNALRSIVPHEVMDRPKAGFSVPLPSWFAGPLAPMFQETVLQGGRCLEYLQAKPIRQMFQENRVGRRDHGLRLWAILMLELWLRDLNSSEVGANASAYVAT